MWERIAVATSDPDFVFLAEVGSGGVALLRDIPASRVSNANPNSMFPPAELSIDELGAGAVVFGKKLVRRCSRDEFSAQLFAKVEEGIALGKLEIVGRPLARWA